MIIPRILAGATIVDKLRYWVAVPLGLGAGMFIGYEIGRPGVAASDVVMAGAAFGLALWLGLSAPPPDEPGRSTAWAAFKRRRS